MRGLSDQSRRTEGQVSRSSRSMGNSLISVRSIARTLAPALAGLGAAQQIRSTISTFADFEQSMAQVAAITRATSAEMGRMTELARQLGSTTEFTASQAASGFRFLGQAGFSAAESIQALPDVLDLATASSLDLGRAADITSNIMSGFGIEASRASEATDVLAAISSRANTDVAQLGDAMSMVAPVAAGLGIEIGDAAAAIGILSDAGIQGGSAGAGLRRVLSSLSNPTTEAQNRIRRMGLTLEEVNPLTNSFTDVVRRLGDAGLETADALQIFGDRGGPAILALTKNSDNLDDLSESMRNAEGEAKRMADTMRDTLTGDLQSLGSAVQDLQISIGSAFNESNRAAVQSITDLVRALGNNMATVTTVAQAAAAIIGTRLVVALGSAAIAKATATSASIAQARATAATTAAEIAFLRTTQASLVAQMRSASSARVASSIRQQLAVNTTALTAATRANAAAVATLSVRARAAAASMAVLRGAMALLGGPAGLAILAAGGIFLYTQRAREATQASLDYAESVETLAGRLNDLGDAQRREAVAGIVKDFSRAREEAGRLEQDIADLQETIRRRDAGELSFAPAGLDDELITLEAALERANERAAAAVEVLKQLRAEQSGAAESSVDLASSIRGVAEASESITASDIIQSLQDEHDALTMSSAALLENRLIREQATEAQIEQALSLNEAIQAINQEREAQQIVDRLKDQHQQLVLTTKQYTAVRLAAAGASSAQVQAAMDALDAIEALNTEADKTLDWADRLSAISDGFGSIRDTMDSGSDAAQRLGVAMQALAVAQGVVAVVNQGTGDPYTAFGRMAAMAAAVASLGVRINSLGGGGPSVSQRRQQTQGAGTVFGDAEAKSESILKATEITADATQQLVGINRGMLSALQMMQRGIDSVSAGLVRQGFGHGSEMLSGMNFGRSAVLGSGVEFLNPASVEMAMIDIFGASPLTEALRDFHGGLFQSINREILRDSKRLQDQGIELIGGSFAAIIDGSIAFAQEYAEVGEKRKFLGVTIRERVNIYTQELSQEVNEGILSVFVGMADSVSAAAEILGMSSSEIERRFREFNVATQLISLHDLDADERQEEIAAVFSSIFDNLAAAVVPYVEEFAQIGEGYAETLTRIATEVQVAEHAVEMLGLRFSELSGRQLVEASSRLIELGGGLDEFISSMQSFTGRFASEAEQFRLNAQNLERGLDGLPLPQTRDGFWQLMQAQDAATEAGARNIATLLRLQAVADQYYDHLEGAADTALSDLRRIVERDMDRVRDAYQDAQQAIQDEAQERLAANQAAISAARSVASEIESELNSVGQALSGLIGEAVSQETRRQSAMQRLVRAVAVGDFTGVGDAAKIAADIDAGRFETASDFRVEQARTIALLSRVQRGADQQLSEAQLQLRAMEAQTSVIEASRDAQISAAEQRHNQEIDRLEGIYDNAKDQLDSLRGIDDGVQTLSEALRAFASALMGVDTSWYDGMGGRANRRNIPGFANGGTHAGGLRIVGERGPEIEATGPSRVMNNKDLMSALGNNERLINEVRQMRQDIKRANFAIAKNTQKTYRQLESWDIRGLPEERVL